MGWMVDFNIASCFLVRLSGRVRCWDGGFGLSFGRLEDVRLEDVDI